MKYNRYKSFKANGAYKKVPFVEVPVSETDRYTYYEVGKTRMDLLSYQYYDDPNFGWLILQANPSCGSLEYKIKDGTKLRIPYPLDIAIQGYENSLGKYIKLYGLD